MRKQATSSLAVLLSFTCGCYTTRQVTTAPIAQPSASAAPERIAARAPEDGFVVDALDGRPTRIDPNTQLRFHRLDGSVSPWFHASELVVSNEGVLVQNTRDGLYWDDVLRIEVKNFSGGKTLGVVAISAAAVVIVVAAVAGAKGGGGGGGGRGTVKAPGGGGSKGGARGPYFRGSGGLYINPSPQPGINVYSGPPVETGTLGSPNLSTPEPSLAQPMFQQDVERKAKAQFVVSLDAGSAQDAPTNPAGSLNVGAATVFRFGNVFELGGGFRQMLPSAEGVALDTFGFFRAGLHLNLDQRHLFAVPINVDMGTNLNNDALLLKINTGLRLQVTPTASLGVLPFNPTYLETPQGFGWSFPSSAELSFSF